MASKNPRHPADPEPVEPGVAQHDQQEQPPPDEPPPPPEEVVLSKEDAMQLFKAGHKLKKKGDPPEKWMQASRIGGALVLCIPVDEEIEKTVLEQQLVLVSE